MARFAIPRQRTGFSGMLLLPFFLRLNGADFLSIDPPCRSCLFLSFVLQFRLLSLSSQESDMWVSLSLNFLARSSSGVIGSPVLSSKLGDTRSAFSVPSSLRTLFSCALEGLARLLPFRPRVSPQGHHLEFISDPLAYGWTFQREILFYPVTPPSGPHSFLVTLSFHECPRHDSFAPPPPPIPLL